MHNQRMKTNVSFFRAIVQHAHAIKAQVVVIATLVFSGATMAIDIANEPLFLADAATPNIMFILDDSGSMDWEILTVPHFEAYNYDRDANRSWARGGWLNWDYRSIGRRNDGDWVSYAGFCNDKNADGICYDRLDLDGDSDDTDHEKAGNSAVAANPNWVLRLKHLYYWEYVNGYCKLAPVSNTDASDYLPNVGNIIAFLTGSTSAQAHVYNGTSWGGSNTPNNGSFSDTDPVYNYEHWSHRNGHYDVGDWANNPAQAAAKATCLSVTGNQWKRSGSGQILHHGPDQHAGLRTGAYPTWSSAPWVSAGSVDNLTGAYTAGNVGGYHQEYKKNIGTGAVAATGSLDINGDGDYDDSSYYERDDWGVKRVNYEYLNELQDNAYRNPKGPWGDNAKPWESCSKGDPAHFTSVSRCHHLIYADYPSGYPYDPLNPAVAATSPWLNGNQNIVTLPSFVPRAIKSSWPNTSISTAVRFDTIVWAADPSRGGATSPVGTHHAMNRYDNWPLISDWRIRSADFNVLYYSPDSDYRPWPTLINADFHAVRSNPQPGTVGYLAPTKDLVRPHAPFTLATPNVPYQEADEGGYVYEIWHDDAGFWSSRPQWHNTDHCGTSGWRASSRGITGMLDPATGIALLANDRVCSTYKDTPNDIVDLWDKHDRVTVYTDKIVVQTVRRTPHIMGEPVGSDASKSYFVSDTRILNQEIYLAGTVYPVDGFCETVLGVDPDNPANCRTVAQVQQNAANWYEFSRRRSFVAKGAIAKLITDIPDLRYGLNVTSSTGGVSDLFKDLPVGAGPYDVHNADVIESMYDYLWPAAGTPLRTALANVGEYFKGNAAAPHDISPITESCQKNFSLMLTDGYWSGVSPTSIGNQDADPYADTLADVAKKYYDDDLDPVLANKVPVNEFDTNNKQHLTTIGVGFGVASSLVDDNGNGWPGNVPDLPLSSKTEASNWGNPASNKQNKINDLWHAAYNSRGLYLNVKNPAELITQLAAAIRFATASTGSASGLAASELTRTVDTRIYQTKFNSDDWSGDVISYSLDASNTLVPEWNAQERLDLPAVTFDNRIIFTSDASGAGMAFRWASLNANQKAALRLKWPNTAVVAANATSNEFGEAQLNFVRGKTDDIRFRTRTHKLGDIAHSKPVYVGAPNAAYNESTTGFAGYNAFKASHSARKMVFAGANDGMLHAFDAATGDEMFAYVPNILIPELNALMHVTTAAQNFVHRYLVDATPVVNDVKFADNSWHSVLVGGLGAGGKGIYALDITTVPTNESAPEDTVLWEFTDVDLNYSYSQPTITKLANGKWAAIFGNGYAKNGEGNGKSVLYIVDIEDGSLIKKIVASDVVATEDNGLSTPTVVDRDGDFIAENVYAGDLKGNLWRFDISDVDSTNWKVSFDGNPLFTANDGGAPADTQAITQKPEIVKHPLGLAAGIMIYVGAGQYIGASDVAGSPYVTQSMYAIWDYYDKQDSSSSHGDFVRTDLLQQKVLAELAHPSGKSVRVTSVTGKKGGTDRDISWLPGQVGDPNWQSTVVDKGWFMDLVNTGVAPLDNKGERIITKAIVSAGAVHINTMLPAEDVCVGGGTGWKMILDATNGARFITPALDVDKDGSFDNADNITWTDEFGVDHVIPVSGLKEDGVLWDSILIGLGGDKSLNLTDTSDDIVGNETLVPTPGARDSWTQLN